jgi:hypothetical protein
MAENPFADFAAEDQAPPPPPLVTMQPSSPRATDAPLSSTKAADDAFHFHRAESGLPFYLSALDIKILKHEYGTYARFPPTLTARIINITETRMTDEVRRRYRYLGHLPLGAPLHMCDLDVAAHVSPGTAAHFAKEIALRERKLRQELEREEARLRRAATAAAAASSEGRSADVPYSSPDLAEQDFLLARAGEVRAAQAAAAEAARGSSVSLDADFPQVPTPRATSSSPPLSALAVSPPAMLLGQGVGSFASAVAPAALPAPTWPRTGASPTIALAEDVGGWTLDLGLSLPAAAAPAGPEGIRPPEARPKGRGRFKPLFSNDTQRRI